MGSDFGTEARNTLDDIKPDTEAPRPICPMEGSAGCKYQTCLMIYDSTANKTESATVVQQCVAFPAPLPCPQQESHPYSDPPL